MNHYQKLKKALNLDKKASIKKKAVYEEDGDYIRMSPDIILESSKKLLDINRGVTDADERDSIRYKHVLTPDKLISERIAMDATKAGKNLMRKISRAKSLKPVNINVFDGYIDSLLFGSSLATPLEEINPLHLVEQKRRITQMGEGGLSGDSSISVEAQAVHPHQFGFIDVLGGPESGRSGVDTRAAWGSKIGNNGLIYQKFVDRKTGKNIWLSPRDLHGKTLGLPE